jgi:hypothetical protein
MIAILALSLAAAAQEVAPGAPPAPEGALYCLRVEATTGTRLETVQCRTRAEWAEWEIDVDQEWAEEGVRVIEDRAG